MDTVQKESIIVKRDSDGEILAIVAYNPSKRTRVLYKITQTDDDDWMELLKTNKDEQKV
jgi:hypothetical protein